jgi:hypothetical protein
MIDFEPQVMLSFADHLPPPAAEFDQPGKFLIQGADSDDIIVNGKRPVVEDDDYVLQIFGAGGPGGFFGFDLTPGTSWLDWFMAGNSDDQGAAYDPQGDDDGDGVANVDEDIVVSSTPEMRAQVAAAYSAAREQATNDVNMGLNFMSGLVTYLGALGRAPGAATAAALLQELNNQREANIAERTNWYLQQDFEDGNLDGHHDTNVIPVPPIPW